MVKCTNCYYEIRSSEFEYCPKCGTKISVELKSKLKKKVKDDSADLIGKQTSKTLDSKVIYGMVFGGIVFILLVLYLSGVFDATKVTPTNTMNPGNVPQTQQPGVDLSAVQKINELEAKVKANPNDHQSLLELAHLRMDSGFYEQAIQNYRTYLEHHPDDADVRIDMGVCYFNLRDFNTAITEMEKALQYQPKHQIGYLNLGVVNLNAGNLEKAKEYFQKAVEINPNTEAGKKAQQLLTSH
ncbi:MAG: tetratricopeptide repeat protein [Ignavibacterium sp.]|nr:tetratricopeptide repeat protein [Ignavibacterium sp.]